MKTKLQSPVVWGVVFTTILAQLEILSKGNVNGWTIAMSVCTVIIAFLGALNNPNDTRNF
jgi:hypothetical protein